ncbi:MAG: ATPase P [Thermoplasmata archaeon YP2-bin.285]|uniref:ATPase P n=1 Tax=Candidatus Sysuiplasma superficiale TaxID=2823368 RepID=A0A8J7YNS5_9ARCH|nr:ATPase P [Candidatus Sysuiplasma superficiale]
MLELSLPGLGTVSLRHLVCDFNGTLASDGKLIDGTAERLNRISSLLDIHVVTSDTYGSAVDELAAVECKVVRLTGKRHDRQKMEYVRRLGPESTVSIGNGSNDQGMLEVSKLSIAVMGREGTSISALHSSDMVVRDILDALDLLLLPDRIRATLRTD